MFAEQFTRTGDGKHRGARYDSAWDANYNFGCKCDKGYRGPDCSLKECESGPDPLGWKGNERGRECSGRGQCDFKTGLCHCHTGYHGAWCQSVLLGK